MKNGKRNTARIEKIKNSAPFKKFDIFLYSIIAVIVLCLFLFLVIIPKTEATQGFCVAQGETEILNFNFQNSHLNVNDGYKGQVLHDSKNQTVTIYTSTDKSEYNVIQYDVENKTVKVIESNCQGKDCINFPEVSSDGGVIYCLPHNLKITPLVVTASEPSTGGRL